MQFLILLQSVTKNSISITFSLLILALINTRIAQATTFVENFDAGELPVNAMITDAGTTLIKGYFFDGGSDNDLYQLQFEQSGSLQIQSHLIGLGFNLDEHAYGSFSLFLFDHLAQPLKQGYGLLNYSVIAGETYYLGMGGLPLDNNNNQLFDLSSSEPILNDAILSNWDNGQDLAYTQALRPYRISLNLMLSEVQVMPQSVPEPGLVIGLGFLGLSGLFQKMLSDEKGID